MMARTFQQKMLALKIGLLEEQRSHLQTVMSATDKVLNLANDWTRNADERSDVTFEELNCLVEDMVLFLGDKYADLPSELDGFERLNIKEMQKTLSCLNNKSKTTQQKQPVMEEYFENTQCIDNCLQTGQESITTKKQDKELLSHKQKCSLNLIQTVIKAQADIEENNHLIQKVINEQKENNDKHEKRLEELTVTLDNILDSMQVLPALVNRVGLLEIESVDNKQFSDVQMRCEILEVNSESVQCTLDDMNAQLQELRSGVEEATKSQAPIPEFKSLEKAEEKIHAFEEEWNKIKEDVGKLYDDFETKNKILCQIIANRLAPLQRLREIFNKRLDARKDNVKKLDAVCNQMADLLPKFHQHETKCERQFAGFIAHKTLTSQPVTNSIVYFSEIIANFGHHFDIQSGTFTSPVDGLYAVSLNINGDKDVGTSIVKQPNKTFLNSLFAGEEVIMGKVTTTANSITASAFIVVDLKAGDGLCVKYGPVETNSSLLRDSTFACFRIG
ncbi:hypothetical protein BsWGS_23373 [Bradybaena similaris]